MFTSNRIMAQTAQELNGQGMSNGMIAKIMGISEDDVRYLIRRESQ